ncbi:hypothetical protein HUU53_03215 [Candidatus Micrarchaeota archaeon]|nr:hypothetical protein [Candidatus Micrarchaeota archaeon]
MTEKKQEDKGIPLTYAVIAILLVAVITAGVFVYTHPSAEATPTPSIEPIPNLKITTIGIRACEACYNVNDIVTQLGHLAEIQTQQFNYDSQEGKDLIEKYGVKKIPSLVIEGDITNAKVKGYLNSLGFEKDNAIVLDNQNPVYFDLKENRFVGQAKLTVIVDSLCVKCTNIYPVISALNENGLKFVQEQTLEYNDTRAVSLIQKHNITRIPSIIVELNVQDYPNFPEIWSQVGTTEDNKTFVFRETKPLFTNPETDLIEGEVSVIYLTDPECTECYNPTIHKNFLSKYDVIFGKENTIGIDTLAGQGLLSAYNITKVPTILLSPEAKYYKKLNDIWPQLGKIYPDGTYVFTNFDTLAKITYFDLEANATKTN